MASNTQLVNGGTVDDINKIVQPLKENIYDRAIVIAMFLKRIV